ncbi:pro-adrenomedullin isoform X1 [Micropterus dolomieu]|uniref:pro-adrenomedullin isoform X1 n=1 Tax=Micropterus dolomieu TaxID=147949 RepID=UPI001E8D78C9|nr:pro-adrenomedullin isoform X1 [Micropterus dolomieu]
MQNTLHLFRKLGRNYRPSHWVWHSDLEKTHLVVHHKFSTSSYKLETKLPDKMKLVLQTVICCCVFTTVLPLVKGATGELNTSLKKRLRVWLQSRMKRDLHNSLGTDNEWYSDVHVGLQQDGNAKIGSPPSSYGIYQILANIRPRRSPPSKSVCYLITCSYHVLVDRVQVANNMQTQAEAPKHKIGKSGYGRRRRSLQDVTQLVLQTGRQRQSTEAGQRVHRHKSTRTVA